MKELTHRLAIIQEQQGMLRKIIEQSTLDNELKVEVFSLLYNIQTACDIADPEASHWAITGLD